MTARRSRTHRLDRPRNGIALVAVLLALALLGVLAAGAVFATTLRIRGDRRLDQSPIALAAAESLAVATLLEWRGPIAARATAAIAVDSTVRTDRRTVRLRVSPLRRGHFVLSLSVDDEAGGGARAGLLLAARRDSLALPMLAALSTNAVVALSSTSTLIGIDAPSADAPACTAADSAAERAPLDSAFDDEWMSSLAAHAELQLASADTPTELTPTPSSIGGRCDVASRLVWGEPMADGEPACRGYFPVVYAAGSLQLNGGRGQGILVVTGDLIMRGDASFVGLVVVRGRVMLADDARIIGALVVRDVDGGGISIADRATVVRSTCTVALVAAAAGAPHPDGLHAWAPLY